MNQNNYLQFVLATYHCKSPLNMGKANSYMDNLKSYFLKRNQKLTHSIFFNFTCEYTFAKNTDIEPRPLSMNLLIEILKCLLAVTPESQYAFFFFEIIMKTLILL